MSPAPVYGCRFFFGYPFSSEMRTEDPQASDGLIEPKVPILLHVPTTNALSDNNCQTCVCLFGTINFTKKKYMAPRMFTLYTIAGAGFQQITVVKNDYLQCRPLNQCSLHGFIERRQQVN